ncbi:hypothetical protein ACWGJP_07195 [Microbacterium sp. NPDC055903]
MTARMVARVAVWLEAGVLILVGWILLAIRTIEQPVKYTEDDFQLIDVSGIGLALLCVGLAILAAVLLFEATRSPDAAVQTPAPAVEDAASA